MEKFVEFHFKSDVLDQFALPDIGYPVPLEFEPRLANCGNQVPFDLMLYCLQQRSADAGHDWRQVESVMQRLIELVSPADDRVSIVAECESWRLRVGSVLLSQQVVTLERDGCLLAALRPDDDGGLVVASYRPLDADSLVLIMRLAVRAHTRYGVAMCPNNWEYALDSTVTTENYYAEKRGEAFLSYFKYGVRDDEANLVPACRTATQLEIFSRLSAVTP